MKRLLELEVMENIDEVIEYDKMKIGTEIDLIDECLAISILNMGVPSGTVLDLGTGTATVPIKIFQYSSEFKITGIDLSSNMLSIAEDNIRKKISSKNPFIEKLKTKRKYGLAEKLIIANYIS
jgi:ubiquinone/menaquinone biosynthesis C-methylase UbiE